MRACCFMLKRTIKGIEIPTVSEKEVEKNMTNQEAEILVKIIEHRLLSKEEQAYLLDKWRKSL